MECLFGITGNGFTLLAADTISARSIVVMKGTENKSRELNAHTVLLYTGEPGDTVNFAEYIQRNIKLYGIRNGIELSPKATATFTRRQLADSLRSRVSSVTKGCLMISNPPLVAPLFSQFDYWWLRFKETTTRALLDRLSWSHGIITILCTRLRCLFLYITHG